MGTFGVLFGSLELGGYFLSGWNGMTGFFCFQLLQYKPIRTDIFFQLETKLSFPY